MKKVVLKLELHDDKGKQRAMKAVCSIPGVDSMTMDMKEKKLIVMGSVDPVAVVSKLRKFCHTEIVSVGPAKEPEKKEEPEKKKEEPEKKESEAKPEEKKTAEPEKKVESETKKVEEKKKEPNDQISELVKAYKAYNPNMTTYHYVPSAEENPNSCVIC